jgi:integrase/recombinase XerD
MRSSLQSSVVEPVVFPPTLAVLAEQYHAHAVRVRGVIEVTANAERPYLRRFFDWYGPPDSPDALFTAISPDSVTKCLISYASEYGHGSRRCLQKTVRLFLRFAYLAGYVQSDLSALSPSVRSPRMGKVARAIPPECIEAVISHRGGDTPADLRDRAMLCLLSTYGVRGVQIRRLRFEDVDWAKSRIHFPAAKGGRPVEQHLSAKAGNRLADYLRKGRPACPCREVFLTTREPFGPLVHPRQLSRILRQRLEQADVKLPQGVAYGSHCFRHAFASRLYGRVPFKDLVDMLGHRDPSTTLIYGKVAVTMLAKAALPWPGGAL